MVLEFTKKMKTEKINLKNGYLNKLYGFYCDSSKVSNFLTKAESTFNLKNSYNCNHRDSTEILLQLPHLIVLNKTEQQIPQNNQGLYIACNIPLGMLMLEMEGYHTKGIDIDKQAIEFGKEKEYDCEIKNALELSRTIEKESLDFTISRNFKRRDYLQDDDIIKILEEEHKILRKGGISISSTLVREYLNEDMETLYDKTPFNDITRYTIHFKQEGSPFSVVDILRK